VHPIVRRRSSLFGHVAGLLEDTPAYQTLRCHISHSVAFQTRVGCDVQAPLGTSGLTNSAGTTIHLLLTCGDKPSCVDTHGLTVKLFIDWK